MKPIKVGIRIWFAIASVVSFLVGWGLFAHSGKPVPLVTQPNVVNPGAMPTLPPIPSLNLNGTQSGFQPLQSLPQVQSLLPRFRTSGS